MQSIDPGGRAALESMMRSIEPVYFPPERPDSQAFGDLLLADMSNKRRRLGALADAIIHGPTERQADQATVEALRKGNLKRANGTRRPYGVQPHVALLQRQFLEGLGGHTAIAEETVRLPGPKPCPCGHRLVDVRRQMGSGKVDFHCGMCQRTLPPEEWNA